jgi:hypothetical protein
MNFINFCEMIFGRYPNMDGALLLSMCDVAYQELLEEEQGI